MRAFSLIASFAALLLQLAQPLPVRADDKDPVVADRKKSEWLDMLRTEDNARRRKVAVSALGQISSTYPDHSKEILTAIGRALRNDTAAGVRLQAAIVLGQSANAILDKAATRVDPRDIVTDLTENLRVEKETDVRKEVCSALGMYGIISKPAVVPLTAALADADPSVRTAAADALGRVGPDAKTALDALILLVKDKELTVRSAAVFAIGRLKLEDNASASAALIPLLKEPDVELRKTAITSLCLLADRNTAVVQSVASALRDENVEIRQRVAQSMSKFGPALKNVESELTRALKEDADKLVRYYALRTLCEGFGPDAKGLLPLLTERLKLEKEFEVQIAIAEELGGIASSSELNKAEMDKLISALREAQRDPNLKVRIAASEAMKRAQKGPVKPK